MLTKLSVKNFKSLLNIEELQLDETVVLIGANNSGKTTILQAIALWHLAARKLVEKKSARKGGERTGTALSNTEIFAIPVKDSREIWRNLTTYKDKKDVTIEIGITAIVEGKELQLFVGFSYTNEKTIHARPVKGKDNSLLSNPELIEKINVAFLPPMSGLAREEDEFSNWASIERRVGEGRTTDVLRNICYSLFSPKAEKQKKGRNPQEDWDFLSAKMREIFLIDLCPPELAANGLIELYYSHKSRKEKLEIASAGRGMQQVLLLLSYFLLQPNTTLLLDEPDAHLEILKQERIYNLLKEIGRKNRSQLIIASHSEVVLNQAIKGDGVIAFYPFSSPKLIQENEIKNLRKSLKDIEVEDYFKAKQKGWVLYLEDSTDLKILQAFAQKLKHPAAEILAEVFSIFVSPEEGKNLTAAKNHFDALKSASADSYQIHGLAIFDGDNKAIPATKEMKFFKEVRWDKRYEIENYFFCKETLLSYASRGSKSDLFTHSEISESEEVMRKLLGDELPPAALRDSHHEFWIRGKASEWLEKILRKYFERLAQPQGRSAKNKFHELVEFMPTELIDEEVCEKLDLIVAIAEEANKKLGKND